MLGAREVDVAPATAVVRALPVRHYWDGGGLLVDGFREPLGLRGPAWDVYLLYGAGVVWGEHALPQPEFWMHQLGSGAPGPPLQAAAFAERAQRALKANRRDPIEDSGAANPR